MEVVHELTHQLDNIQLEDDIFLQRIGYNPNFSLLLNTVNPCIPTTCAQTESFPGTKEELINAIILSNIVPSSCFEICRNTTTFHHFFAQLAAAYLEHYQLFSEFQTTLTEALKKKREAYQQCGIYFPFDDTSSKVIQKINDNRSNLLSACCSATAQLAQLCLTKYQQPTPASPSFDFTKQYQPRRKIKIRVPIPPEAKAVLDMYWDTHLEEDGKCYITVEERAQLADQLQLKEATVAVSAFIHPCDFFDGEELFSKQTMQKQAPSTFHPPHLHEPCIQLFALTIQRISCPAFACSSSTN